MFSYQTVMIIGMLTMFPLAIIAAKRLYTFPAIYFIVDIFYTKADLNLLLGGSTFTISRFFLLSFAISYMFIYRKNFKNICLSIFADLKSNKPLLYLIVWYLLSPFLVILYSLLAYSFFPSGYIRNAIIASWGIGLGLLIPVSSDFTLKMIKTWGISILVTVVVFIVPTMRYYLLAHESVSRSFAVLHPEKDFLLRYIYFLPRDISDELFYFRRWLALDPTSKNVFAAGMGSLISILFRTLSRCFASLCFFISTFLLVLAIHIFVYYNFNFTTVGSLVLTMFFSIGLYLFYKQHRDHNNSTSRFVAVLLLTLLIFTHVFGPRYYNFEYFTSALPVETIIGENNLDDKFSWESSKAIRGKGRVERIRIFFWETFKQNIWTGYGIDQVALHPEKLDFIVTKCDFFDIIMFWGLIGGFLVVPYFFIPVGALLFVKWEKHNYYDISFWSIYFLIISAIFTMDSYGATTPGMAIQQMMTILFFKYKYITEKLEVR